MILHFETKRNMKTFTYRQQLIHDVHAQISQECKKTDGTTVDSRLDSDGFQPFPAGVGIDNCDGEVFRHFRQSRIPHIRVCDENPPYLQAASQQSI